MRLHLAHNLHLVARRALVRPARAARRKLAVHGRHYAFDPPVGAPCCRPYIRSECTACLVKHFTAGRRVLSAELDGNVLWEPSGNGMASMPSPCTRKVNPPRAGPAFGSSL